MDIEGDDGRMARLDESRWAGGFLRAEMHQGDAVEGGDLDDLKTVWKKKGLKK